MYSSSLHSYSLLMVFLHGHSEIQRRKQREHICLDKGDQQFQQSHENSEQDGYNRNGIAQDNVDVTKNEDQADEAQHDDMARSDVGEETDHQDEGLGKDAHEFHQGHEGKGKFKPPGHAGGVVNVLPVVPVANESGNDKGNERHDHRYGDIARKVGSAGEKGNKSDQVVKENEKEQGKQVWHEPFVFMIPDRGSCHIPDKQDDRLQDRLKPFWRMTLPFPVRPGNRDKNNADQDTTDEQSQHILGDRQIQRQWCILIGFHAVANDPDDLSLVLPFRFQFETLVGSMSVMES